jgi:hypothetical protein
VTGAKSCLSGHDFSKGVYNANAESAAPIIGLYVGERRIQAEFRFAAKPSSARLRNYPTESKAQQAPSALRITINQEKPREIQNPITVSDLIHHFKESELNTSNDWEGKAYSTRVAYAYFLDHWIQPRWGESNLRDVRTIAIEQWLRGLRKSDGKNLAPGTKAKIRNIMSALFNHAMRYEWMSQGKNPVTLVRQSAKRVRIPDILEIEEIQALFAALTPRECARFAPCGTLIGPLMDPPWSEECPSVACVPQHPV